MTVSMGLIAVFVSALGVVTTISIYLDQKKSRRFDKMEAFNSIIRCDLDNTKQEVAIIKSEVGIHKASVEKQFMQVERSQIESRDIILRQVDEIKEIIQGLSDKLERFFTTTQELNIKVAELKVAEHITKSER